MTINEFKAWLEGFEEGVKSSPNAAQWKKIKERLEAVKASEPTIIYHGNGYPRSWWPNWYSTADDPTYQANYVYNTCGTGNEFDTIATSARTIGRQESARLT